jgi:threonine synthase
VFGETAAGVTVAVLGRLAAEGAFAQGERVVALVTGHGLKTREVLEGGDGAEGFGGSVIPVRPNIDALEDALADRRPGLVGAG